MAELDLEARSECLWSLWVSEKPSGRLSFLLGKPPWTHPFLSLTHLCSLFSSVTHCCVTSGSGLTSLFLGLQSGVCWTSELYQREGDLGTPWVAPALGIPGSRQRAPWLAEMGKGDQALIFTMTSTSFPLLPLPDHQLPLSTPSPGHCWLCDPKEVTSLHLSEQVFSSMRVGHRDPCQGHRRPSINEVCSR